jgi:peroxiredoxin (alkyl hydroperoxide reductase subunit C)
LIPAKGNKGPHSNPDQPSDLKGITMNQDSHQPETPTLPALPRLNEKAPDFEARTTHGPKRLSDYQGRWLILFSHPADFTPVCTTEFMAFAKAWPEFQDRECDLLGLSIDSTFSHLAWIRNIEEKFGVEIPFPIIEDLSMKVAHDYGMIMPGASDTSTVRTTFFIDPKGMTRAMIYYPMSNGRSIAEFLRLLDALQTSDAHQVATPEGWKPGEQVIVPPPSTVAAANARMEEGYDCKDWYFCKTDVPKLAMQES